VIDTLANRSHGAPVHREPHHWQPFPEGVDLGRFESVLDAEASRWQLPGLDQLLHHAPRTVEHQGYIGGRQEWGQGHHG
jgi:hypothetical protein